MTALLVAVAAGLGAVVRYVVDLLVTRRLSRLFPYGTFCVNVTGSLLLGLTTGLALHHGLSPRPGAVVGAGFAGGYTTLSTWAWESLSLVEAEAPAAALGNVAGSFAAGLAAAAAGLGLALL